jgi:hypothetical protein
MDCNTALAVLALLLDNRVTSIIVRLSRLD